MWRHRIGSGEPSELVYHEADERFWLGVGRTRSEAYVVIAAGSSITSEFRYADSADSHAEFTVVLPRREGVEYSVEHAVVGGQDRFLILHNDGAVNFTLAEAPVTDPTQQRTLIPHRDDVRLEGMDAFAGHLVVSYRRAALPRIQLWPLDSDGGYGKPEEISFDSELMSSGLGGNPNWDSPKLRIGAGRWSLRCGYTTSTWKAGSARCCASNPCSVTTGRKITSSGASGRKPTTALGFRYRSCIARASNSRQRRWYTAMELTKSARIQAFPWRGCRYWTAAWFSSLPTFAVAVRWAGCGTSAANSGEEEHLHRLHRGGKASGGIGADPTARAGGVGW